MEHVWIAQHENPNHLSHWNSYQYTHYNKSELSILPLSANNAKYDVLSVLPMTDENSTTGLVDCRKLNINHVLQTIKTLQSYCLQKYSKWKVVLFVAKDAFVPTQSTACLDLISQLSNRFVHYPNITVEWVPHQNDMLLRIVQYCSQYTSIRNSINKNALTMKAISSQQYELMQIVSPYHLQHAQKWEYVLRAWRLEGGKNIKTSVIHWFVNTQIQTHASCSCATISHHTMCMTPDTLVQCLETSISALQKITSTPISNLNKLLSAMFDVNKTHTKSISLPLILQYQ